MKKGNLMFTTAADRGRVREVEHGFREQPLSDGSVLEFGAQQSGETDLRKLPTVSWGSGVKGQPTRRRAG